MKISKRTGDLIRYLQQRRRLEVLIAAYENETEWFNWSYMRDTIHVSDGTYRKCMRELEKMGLVDRVRYDNDFKSKFRLTDLGCCIASIVREKIIDIDFLLTRADGKKCVPVLQST